MAALVNPKTFRMPRLGRVGPHVHCLARGLVGGGYCIPIINPGCLEDLGITLPETNSSPLKIDGWTTILSY